ncbi:MAG: deaminase [Aquificae bacterium]|nr:deaminase [Aquificota bacterium]
MKEIKTGGAPSPVGPYSQALLVGGFLFISGQIGVNPETGKLEEGFERQVKRVLTSIEAVLKEAGLSKRNLVRVCVYLTDLKLFPRFNELYAEFLEGVEPKPVRVTVGVKELPLGALVEIEAVAYAG